MSAELWIMKFKTTILIIFIGSFYSFSQPEISDSINIEYSNNLHLKPRFLFGTGLSTPVKKYDTLLKLFGSFNLRLCSDEKSWENRQTSFFIEAGASYFNTSLDRSSENSLIIFFKFGPEIKIMNELFLCHALGGLGVLNVGPEANNPFAVGFGLSLNYSFNVFENINLDIESGTNLLPQNGGYPIWTPYLGIGISI